MRTKYLYLIIFIIQCNYAQATPQRPNIIIINNIEHDLFGDSIMEIYYENFPRRRPRQTWQTNLYRGYIAIYEIKNNELLINDINGQRNEIENIRISDFNWINNLYRKLRERFSNLPHIIKAEWYSGLLFIAQNRLNFSYEPESESGYFTIIEIENGNQINSFILNTEQCRIYFRARYDIITQADVFENIYNRLIDSNMPNEILEYFIRTYND